MAPRGSFQHLPSGSQFVCHIFCHGFVVLQSRSEVFEQGAISERLEASLLRVALILAGAPVAATRLRFPTS